MTQADVQELIEQAKSKFGRIIDDFDASVFLGAQEILAEDSTNAHAAEVVRVFNTYMKTGVKKTSFAEFLLPLPYTDEEIAASDRSRNEYIEIYRRYALVGIAEGDYAAAQAFKTKHNLTCEQILAMTDNEIKALAA